MDDRWRTRADDRWKMIKENMIHILILNILFIIIYTSSNALHPEPSFFAFYSLRRLRFYYAAMVSRFFEISTLVVVQNSKFLLSFISLGILHFRARRPGLRTSFLFFPSGIQAPGLLQPLVIQILLIRFKPVRFKKKGHEYR